MSLIFFLALKQAKPIAQQMIEQIREAFKENLASLDWMDPSTKKLAIEKVRLSAFFERIFFS